MKKSICAAALTAFLLTFFSCSAKKTQAHSIAVFVPGIIADSPIYAMLAEGVQHAVASYNDGKDGSVQPNGRQSSPPLPRSKNTASSFHRIRRCRNSSNRLPHSFRIKSLFCSMPINRETRRWQPYVTINTNSRILPAIWRAS